MFWNIFLDLCNKNGIKPNPLAKRLGISSGAVTRWKNGSIPNDSTLLKIANYFGVTVAYLKGEEKTPVKETTSVLSDEEVVYHRDGKPLVIKLNPEQKKMFDFWVNSQE